MVWAFKRQQTAYSGEAHDSTLCNPRLSLQMGAWFYSGFGTNEGGGFLCFSLPQEDIELELKWSWSQEDELSEPPLSKGDCSRKLGNTRRGIRSERWWRKEKDRAGDPSPKAGTLLETQHVDSCLLRATRIPKCIPATPVLSTMKDRRRKRPSAEPLGHSTPPERTTPTQTWS